MITFTDKNGRPVRIKTATVDETSAQYDTDDIVLALLLQAPMSEYIIPPSAIRSDPAPAYPPAQHLKRGQR